MNGGKLKQMHDRKILHFCWTSLFIFGRSYFVKALVFMFQPTYLVIHHYVNPIRPFSDPLCIFWLDLTFSGLTCKVNAQFHFYSGLKSFHKQQIELKKCLTHKLFRAKNLYSVGCAILCSKSVVILKVRLSQNGFMKSSIFLKMT